jgi:hypothetical protein
MSNLLIDNRKIIDGIIATPGSNTNTWYCREPNNSFSINGAFNGAESIFDWVLTKTTNSKYIKSGVMRISAAKKSAVILFDTAFPSTDYFVFFSSNANVKMFYVDKKINRFVINASWNVGSEITWIAFHKEFAKKTGINNPGSIFLGSRTFGAPIPDIILPDGSILETLDIKNDAYANMTSWYHNEYIIKPTAFMDGIQQTPNLTDYSVILTPSSNINMFWCEKATDRVKIATSYPKQCIIDYLLIKKGIDWWDEF